MKSRQWIYLGVLSLLFSCANREANKNNEAFMEVAIEKPVELSTSEAYTLVIEEKIKEHIEQLKLQQNHPEFEYSYNGEIPFLNTITTQTELERIELLGQEVIGDTTLIQFTLHLTEERDIAQGTLMAMMVTKEIELKGEVFKTTTISFQE